MNGYFSIPSNKVRARQKTETDTLFEQGVDGSQNTQLHAMQRHCNSAVTAPRCTVHCSNVKHHRLVMFAETMHSEKWRCLGTMHPGSVVRRYGSVNTPWFRGEMS